jgi:hypothetical protein
MQEDAIPTGSGAGFFFSKAHISTAGQQTVIYLE